MDAGAGYLAGVLVCGLCGSTHLAVWPSSRLSGFQCATCDEIGGCEMDGAAFLVGTTEVPGAVSIEIHDTLKRLEARRQRQMLN